MAVVLQMATRQSSVEEGGRSSAAEVLAVVFLASVGRNCVYACLYAISNKLAKYCRC